MVNFAQLASQRRSIRKFEQKDIDVSEIVECVKVATTAPSGCNSQCWEFIVIHNKEKIAELANVVTRKEESLLAELKIPHDPAYYESRMKGLTIFKNAPVCVAVYMTKLDYYDKKMEQALYDSGYTYDGIMALFGYPDLLSIGAAIQNLLLALTEKGYGACWMNDPIVAKDEISGFLGMPADSRLISLIPIGMSAYTPRGKKFKPLDEVLRIIE